MFNSILVVCVGNICRSPTGERLLKRALPNKLIDSAGIKAVKNSPADGDAFSVAFKNGLSLENHIARQLSLTMCRQYELILVMEKRHIEAVCLIAPEVRGKTMLFGHWLNQREISDPYRQSIESYEYTYELLDEASKKWVEVLTKETRS
ncbi:arsenate reductase/protein-tyrosine-phosphatase family protein [Serratia fonticola]|uniref:arsenate reductase/protein-tyrosine-phosphatase family protein n=1 Tax=Serratia fonticola TaxID=47917 RepID=UPI0021BD12F7|nr:protein tyrosine phosphatase [Serratia fonticola]